MPEVKYVISTEANLAGIKSTTAELDKLTAAEKRASAAAVSHKADIKSVTLEQYNLDSATVGTAAAMGKAAEATTKATVAKRGMIPVLGLLNKAAIVAGAGIGFLSRSLVALKFALVQTGIGILLVAVGALVGWLIKLTSKSDEAKESIGKLADKISVAAGKQREFAASTRDAAEAMEGKFDAELKRAEQVEKAKMDAGQKVEAAQLEARIDSGELTGEGAIRARTGLAERHRMAREGLDERVRASRETVLGRVGAAAGGDVARAQAELASAQAARDTFETTPFDQLSPMHKALMLSGRRTREQILGQFDANVTSAQTNLAGIQAGSAPVLERVRQGQMDVGAERMVAGFASGAAGTTAGIDMNSKILAENQKQTALQEKQLAELQRSNSALEQSIREIKGRSKTLRD